jgi:hypothetical protein
MPFNSRISLKQSESIFYVIFGAIIIFLVYSYAQSSRKLLLVLGCLFIIHGFSSFFEDSKKRYKILTAPNEGNYDSNSEKKVGDYFRRRNIKFHVHPILKFPSKIWIFDNHFKKVKLKPDFYLPEYDIYVEYWGMMDNEEYKERFKRKMKIYQENDIKVISLYEKNLANLDWDFTQKLLSLFRDQEGNNIWGND